MVYDQDLPVLRPHHSLWTETSLEVQQLWLTNPLPQPLTLCMQDQRPCVKMKIRQNGG